MQYHAAYTSSSFFKGVVGFRIDAAKHIPSNLLGAITGGLSKPVLLAQVRHDLPKTMQSSS